MSIDEQSDTLLSQYPLHPIPIVVHLFTRELKKYSTPLATIHVVLSETEQTVCVDLVKAHRGIEVRSRNVFSFGILCAWSNTKAVNMAYEILLSMHIDFVRECLRMSHSRVD